MKMENHGFVRISAAIPPVKVADCGFNIRGMMKLIQQAEQQDAGVILFPGLSITGYTCADLFLHQSLLDEAEKALEWLLMETCNSPLLIIAGMPLRVEDMLYNVAVVMQQGRLLGIVPKTHLPNNNEF